MIPTYQSNLRIQVYECFRGVRKLDFKPNSIKEGLDDENCFVSKIWIKSNLRDLDISFTVGNLNFESKIDKFYKEHTINLHSDKPEITIMTDLRHYDRITFLVEYYLFNNLLPFGEALT